MKKVLTITSLAVMSMLLGLTACTPNNTSSMVDLTSVNAVEGLTAFSITNKEDLTKAWINGEADRQVEFSFTPTQNAASLIANKQLRLVSSNTEAVATNGAFISAVGVGEATVTAYCGSLKDSFNVTVSDFEDVAEKSATVGELITAAKSLSDYDHKTLYTVTGYASAVQNSAYGDFDLYSEDLSQKIIVYGSTLSNPFTYTKGKHADKSEGNISVSFTNPKDFKYGETVLEGYKVTMKAMLTNYNGTPEIVGQLTNVDKSTATSANWGAKVSVNDETMGSASIDKSTGITIGNTLSVTVTPAEGHSVDTVKVNGKTIQAGTDGKYTFTAGIVNNVVVNFIVTPTDLSGTILDDPYTVDEAIAAYDAAGKDLENKYVSGIVSSAEYSEKYNYTIWLKSDDGKTEKKLELFRAKRDDSEAGEYTSDEDVKSMVGKYIVAYGTITKFKGTYEMNAGNKFRVAGGTESDPYTANEVAQLLKADTKTTIHDSEVYVTGKVTSSSYKKDYKSYTIWIESDGGTTEKIFEFYSVGLDSSITDDYTAKDALKGATVTGKGYLETFVNSKSGDITYEMPYLSDKNSPSGKKYTPSITKVVKAAA